MNERLSLPFDIIEPPVPAAPPADHAWAIPTGALVALVLLGWAGLRWWRTRRLRRARRRLKQAQRAFASGELSAAQAAFAIAEALRTGLHCKRIVASHDSDGGWRAFVERLDRARYRGHVEDAAEIGLLFAQAAAWLKGKSPC